MSNTLKAYGTVTAIALLILTVCSGLAWHFITQILESFS